MLLIIMHMSLRTTVVSEMKQKKHLEGFSMDVDRVSNGFFFIDKTENFGDFLKSVDYRSID